MLLMGHYRDSIHMISSRHGFVIRISMVQISITFGPTKMNLVICGVHYFLATNKMDSVYFWRIVHPRVPTIVSKPRIPTAHHAMLIA